MTKNDPGVALVTGASSGIGRSTAGALHKAGYRVFGTSRRPASESTDGVAMLTCDVTNDASVAKLVDDVLGKAGRIDLLVNNAGVGLLGGAEESSMAHPHILRCANLRSWRRFLASAATYGFDQCSVPSHADRKERSSIVTSRHAGRAVERVAPSLPSYRE